MEIGGFEIGTAFLITAVAVIAIWILIEIKRLKHKIFAVFLVILILSLYVTANHSLKGQDIDFKTIPGIIKAGKIYFALIVSIYNNLKTITTNAIKMNWGGQNSSIE